MPDSLFVRDESDSATFHPTELARGPWSPLAQHGGPPSALLAMALESYDDHKAPRMGPHTDGPMFVARLSVELLKPVPLTPLQLRVRADRPGRKVQVLTASLTSGDTEVASATAVRIRCKSLEMPDAAFPDLARPAAPTEGSSSVPPWHKPSGDLTFHADAVDHRFVSGSFDQPGPSVDWIRLRVPLVLGEETPPISRVAAAADFGNGISWTLSRVDGYMFINPDLTLYLHDYPSTEWVCLDAITWPQHHGVGLAESRLWGEQGALGRSLQSLLLDRED